VGTVLVEPILNRLSRHARDNETDFHYSRLIVLIALAGWKETKFSTIFRMGKCYAARYESLWKEKDRKMHDGNNIIFAMLLE
jgi:hypothetical protein